MADLTPTPGAQVANGTYSLTNPLTGTNGTAVTAPRSDMRPTVPAPGTVSTISSGASPGNGAGTGFATDTHIHGAPTLAAASLVGPLAADAVFTNNNTLANLSGMAVAVAANTKYIVRAFLPLTCLFAAVNGAKFQITGPTSPTQVEYVINVWDGTLWTPSTRQTALSQSLSTNNITAANAFIMLEMYFANGVNAGTLQVQGAQVTNGSNTITYKQGAEIYAVVVS